jgi:hypothetical protein
VNADALGGVWEVGEGGPLLFDALAGKEKETCFRGGEQHGRIGGDLAVSTSVSDGGEANFHQDINRFDAAANTSLSCFSSKRMLSY